MAGSGTRRLVQSMGEAGDKSASQIQDSFYDENKIAAGGSLDSRSAKQMKGVRPKLHGKGANYNG